jgi:hypothetical protein
MRTKPGSGTITRRIMAGVSGMALASLCKWWLAWFLDQ